ncbi:MAG: quinone oxidoreductase [Alphaproteobacteria bacterium]|jgi:NADPH2:quinone reductase|nr:quinone oxidoreductase [Alphaproteobacteria bacterium]
MQAIRVHRHGGPEVMTLDDVAAGPPRAGEVRVRHRAIGVNFVDTYFRSGAYAPPALPFIPGNEAAGEILEVGAGVEDFAPGDRVAYVAVLGAYAEARNVDARLVVRLPHAIGFEQAATMMLKGLTAHYLLHRTFSVGAGHTVLIHAAAGGLGLILTQWARHLGARVIGTVGSAAKARLVQARGADHVIDYEREDFAARIREITGGRGVDVVYDGVGRKTFAGSLASLRPLGLLVSHGAASGPVEPFDIALLMQKGSLYATSPQLFTHLENREDVVAMSRHLFDVVASGAVRMTIEASLPLSEAAEAHRLLEGRATSGAMVLIPD